MAVTDIRQQNTNVTTALQAGATASDKSAHAINVSDATSADYLTTGNSSNTKQKTLRSRGVVDQNLQNITNQTGLDKNKILELIQKMSGKSYEDLLNLPQKDYNKLTRGLLLIIKDCMVNGKIDSEKLEQATRDYHTATQTGWSLEGFRNQQKNVKKSTLSQRLIETGCLAKPIDPQDPDYDAKMEAAIEKFFAKTLLSRIGKNTSEAERKRIYLQQLQTFGRILVNTPPGRDKELLGSAIDKLYRANIVPAAQAGIDAMETTEAKANFAKHIDYNEAVTTASEYEEGVYMTKGQAQDLAHIKYSNMNADDIKADLPAMRREAEIFFEKNKEILAKIEQKLENNEELTPEEEAILREKENLHISRYVGLQTGVANTHNPTVEEEKENLLKTINNDIYEIGEKAGNDFYREVMTEVVEYIDEHPECLTMSKENFTKLMDEVTGGNYSTVIADIKNGTISELTSPSQASGYVPAPATDATSNGSSSTEFGFALPEEPINPANPNESKARLYEQASAPTDETLVEEAPAADGTKQDITKINTTKGFMTYIKNNGAITAVVDVYSNLDKMSQGVINSATNIYKNLANLQERVLHDVNYTGLIALLPNTNKSVTNNLEGEVFENYAATKAVRDFVKEDVV